MRTSLLILLVIAFINFSNILKAQTVIEMTHPGDANLVLLVVDDIAKADIVIYRTDDKIDAEEWDCMWKFRQWGFSNFSIYLTKNPNDSLLTDPEMGINYQLMGKVYFTDKKDERGYKTPGFQLEGVFRKTSVVKSEESTKSKEKARKEAEDKFGE
ncbi:MAG: hypothetical protein HY951_12830 [Bacteroidia bacterium]|nr:hypothetical protein [Bacteroidia bacterium]